jgi:hypothetical protein
LKKQGRPPSGLGKNGEPSRIRDYPRLCVTVRPATRARLLAVAAQEARPAWKIVEDGINLYIERLTTREGTAKKGANRRSLQAGGN